MKFLLIPSFVAFGGLFQLPIEVYTIIRWIIFCSCGLALFDYIKLSNNNRNIVIILCVIVLIYNPLIPFYLSRDYWVTVDVVAGSFLLWLSFVPIQTLKTPGAVEELVENNAKAVDNSLDKLMIIMLKGCVLSFIAYFIVQLFFGK